MLPLACTAFLSVFSACIQLMFVRLGVYTILTEFVCVDRLAQTDRRRSALVCLNSWVKPSSRGGGASWTNFSSRADFKTLDPRFWSASVFSPPSVQYRDTEGKTSIVVQKALLFPAGWRQTHVRCPEGHNVLRLSSPSPSTSRVLPWWVLMKLTRSEPELADIPPWGLLD